MTDRELIKPNTYTDQFVMKKSYISKQKVKVIEKIELTGLATLKIVRHCNEVLKENVSGTLLGLIKGTILEIKDCYRTILDITNYRDYALSMEDCLGQLGIENYIVGWYGQSQHYDFLYSKRVVMDCFLNQESAYFSVCLIYDSTNSCPGKLALKAFRLRNEMLEQLRYDPICSAESLLKYHICERDVFEEIKIEITNHNLINTFLFEIRNLSELPNYNYSSLLMNDEDDITNLVSRLGSAINRFKNEQTILKLYNRELDSWYLQRSSFVKGNFKKRDRGCEEFEAKHKRPVSKGYLECILTTTQINEISNQILETVSSDFYRIWVTKIMK